MKSKIIQVIPRKMGNDLKRIFVQGMPDTETLSEFFSQPDDMYTAPVELVVSICNTLCIDTTSKYDRYSHTVLIMNHMLLTERLNLPTVKSKPIKDSSVDYDLLLRTGNIHWRTPFINYAPRLTYVIFCCKASDFDYAYSQFQSFCQHITNNESPNPFLSAPKFKKERESFNRVANSFFGFQYSIEANSSVDIFYIHLVKDLIQ